MERFSVSAISPERILYRGEASEVVVPAEEGVMSILARHAPLLATLGKGTLRIIKDSSEDSFEIEKGFIEISGKSETEERGGSNFVNIFVRPSGGAG